MIRGSLVRTPAVRPGGRSSGPTIATLVLVAVGVTIAVVLSPLVPLAAGALAMVARRRRSSAERLERRRSIDEALPIAASLFAVALQSGRTVASASAAIGPLLAGPVGAALVDFDRRQHLHVDTQRSLDRLEHDLGRSGAEFVELLRSSLTDGAAVADALHSLGDEHRRRRRRALEAALRRLPVVLLLPLVTCVLPAFMLLTVVAPVVEAIVELTP